MDHLDQSLVVAYTSFGKSADQIAAYTRLRSEFLARLPAETRAAGDDAIVWRLLQLRKSGKLPKGHTRGN